MNFLRPELLFGLFALAIPVIIHLFNFRRTKRVYFSNTAFLKKVKEASSSKLKLKHYLILFSRLLFITFLVLAFAQPYLITDNSAPPSDKVVIYLDNSLSMSNEGMNGLSAFDGAIAAVNGILSVYPTSTEYRLITNGFESGSNRYVSMNEVEDYLSNLSLTGTPRSLKEIQGHIHREVLADSADVYWISDFQKSTMGEPVSLDSIYDVNLISIPTVGSANISIDSIYIENPFLMGSGKIKLHVILNNKGSVEADEVGVKVLIDSIQAATTLVEIPANDKHHVMFDLSFDLNKTSKGIVTIEDYPIAYDNEFYFILQSSKRIGITEIRGRNSESYIEKVYGNNQLFDFNSTDEGVVNFQSLINSDLVVVNGVNTLSTSLVSALQKRIGRNQAVMIIPSPAPDLSSYDNLIGGLGVVEVEDMISLQTPDFDNPFFDRVFEERTGRISMPKAIPSMLLPADRDGLLKFQNGRSFLSRRGDLYVMAGPLDNEFTNFHRHALFVPVMYRIAALSVKENDRLYYYTDESTILTDVDTLTSDLIFKLRNGQQELIPSQRNVNGNLMMEVPKFLLSPGFYQLTHGGESLRPFAFNVPSAESNVDKVPLDELVDYFDNTVNIIEGNEELTFENAVKNKYGGTPLWKYAIILALIFLLAEVLLIRFMR